MQIKLYFKTLWPLFMDGFQLPQSCSHFKEAVYFLPLSSQKFLVYSFYRPRKDEKLSRPWSHTVVLNTGPLDWKSSTLTTRVLLPLLRKWLTSKKNMELNRTIVKYFSIFAIIKLTMGWLPLGMFSSSHEKNHVSISAKQRLEQLKQVSNGQ